MRSRNIKPGFYRNENLAECSLEARFVFPGLWMLADKDGRLEYRPKRIKVDLMPFDNVDMAQLLDELNQWGLIKIYETEGSKYIWIPKFLDHQNPHRKEKGSIIPRHPEDITPENSGFSEEWTDQAQESPVKDSPLPVQAQKKTDQARLIPDSCILIPDILIPELKASCPELQKNEAPDPQPEVEKEIPFLTIPLVTKNKATGEPEEFPVYAYHLSGWSDCFPALDIPQVVREIKAWNLANPANRKTKSGILKHINGWLTKEQNKAKPHVRGQPTLGRVIPMTQQDRNKLACDEAMRRYGNAPE